ncbi:MAG: hypothetical protein ABSH53_16615 [Holophaga sp.]|jgi:hypothetical protein
MNYSKFALLAGSLLAAGSALPGAATPHAAAIANTGYITAPALVSAGMTNILAFVPAQAGATYQWSATGGAIPGITRNAAVYFNAGAAGTATVQCVVTLSGVQTTYTQDIPVQAPFPVTPAFYGSGYGADALANTVLGGPSLNAASYRFQAQHAAPLKGIRVFFIWSLVKSGYQAGQGGTVQVDLEADDGTAAHLPTGVSLASVTYGNILAQNENYPELTFPSPASLKGGGIYHLVFTNIDPTPATNYISLDCLYTDAQTAPMQPSFSDATLAALVRSGSGPWKLRSNFTPILELDYSNGATQGTGYMEVWSTNPKLVSGNAMVRESFKVSGPSRTFSKVKVRLQRTSGSSPLTVQVTEADGTVIATGTVPAASVLEGVSDWVTCAFPLSYVLSTGVAYDLTLSSPADTQYSIYPIRKGHDKGFSNYTFFPDGCAQYTTTGAAGWTGWDMWGTPNLSDDDLQFMFVP